MIVRLATPRDFPFFRAIYARYMATPVTFEEELPSEEAFARRLSALSGRFPCLAAEEKGRVLGYAYAHCPWERPAYRWNAELSVYLDPGARGRGAGTRLYALLLDLLRRQGFRTALGCVTVPNAASEALHRHFGFLEAARFPRAGFKNGAWHDVVWLALPLTADWAPPEDPLPLTALGLPVNLALSEPDPETCFFPLIPF